MNINEALDYIEKTMKFGSKLGLHRMKLILKELNNPHLKLKCIHVAGTNGKGSTSALICQMLMEKGLNVGLFTSPHIESFNERMQINRKYITNDKIIELVEIVKPVIEKLTDEGMEHPTEFEIVTSMMFLYFYREKVDYCVIEVGLGGDLDSTNVINPILSVITHIALDHEKILGNTLSEIAKAKAGIIKKAPVINYIQEIEAQKIIEEKCKEQNVELINICKKDAEFKDFSIKENKQIIEYCINKFNFKLLAKLNLLGTYQVYNSLCAINAVLKLNEMYELNITKDNIVKALEEVEWMGRFEIVKSNPTILLDGAHNIDGVIRLKETLNKYYKNTNYILILGILADKNVTEMVDVLAKNAKRVICVTPNSERASLAIDLNEIVKSINKNTQYTDNYLDAIEMAKSYAKNNDIIVISGSLYMIGDMRKIFLRNNKST